MNGHSWKDIQSYTLSEIGVFIRECTISKQEEQKIDIINIWTGQKATEKYIKKLENELKNLRSNFYRQARIESGDPEAVRNEWNRLAMRMQGGFK